MAAMNTTFELSPEELNRAVREYVERRYPGSQVSVVRANLKVTKRVKGLFTYNYIPDLVSVSGDLYLPDNTSEV